MPERHSVEYMANILQAAVQEWGIADSGSYTLRGGSHQYPDFKKVDPTPTHLAYCKLTGDIVNDHNPALC